MEGIEDVALREEERTMLTQHCMEVLEPGYEYFKKNLLAGDVGVNLPLFKAVRLANPAYVKHALASKGIEALKTQVQRLIVMKCVHENRIQALLAELPSYTHHCTEYAGDWLFSPPTPWTTLFDVQSFKKIHHDSVGLPILQFFERFSAHFPTWASFAEDVFILSPTSAAVERLFSLLRDKSDDKSKQSLIDYISASLMLRGNKRQLCP